MQNCNECGGKRWYAKLNRKTGLQETHVIKYEDKSYTLRVWRCFRCGHVQNDEVPYILPGIFRTGASILYIDLEVSKTMLYNYGLRVPSKYINPDNIVHEYYIICWSASYMHDDKIWSDCVTKEEAQDWTDKNRMSHLRDLMASADIIAGHNVDAYDIKRANTKFLLAGLEPVIGKPTFDTLKIARTKFAFESNKLDYISKKLGLRPKDDITDDDWQKIVRTGDKKTLQKVNKYCQGDVREGKRVLEKLMKYSGKKRYWGSITVDAINL